MSEAKALYYFCNLIKYAVCCLESITKWSKARSCFFKSALIAINTNYSEIFKTCKKRFCVATQSKSCIDNDWISR